VIAQLDTLYGRIRPWKLWSRLLGYAMFEGRPLTTRGRWINPIVFGHFALERHLPQLKQVDRPVFILGTGRSGTTVLGMVLSMHREVGFLNEPKALWHAIHSGEDLIGSYGHAQAHYRLGAEDATPVVRRNAHRLFGAYLAASFSKRLVNKYPELIFRVPFVQAIFPDARFVLVVRNGWDTIQSIEEWQRSLRRHQMDTSHDWWGADRRKWKLLVEQVLPEHPDLAPHASAMSDWTSHIAMAAVEWIVTMREGFNLQSRHSDVILRVDYERLCAEPGAVLENIAAFLGLTPGDDAYMRYGIQTLKPVRARPSCSIPAILDDSFNQTMRLLGY
jgi:hypothetical protein